MVFGRLCRVLLRMGCMAFCGVSVMARRFVITSFVVLGRFLVVLGRRLMVMRRLPVVLCPFVFSHCDSPFKCAAARTSAGALGFQPVPLSWCSGIRLEEI